MTVSLSAFLQQLVTSPPLLITVLLTLGVILVNGWTDAPNAIATCVSTRSIKPRHAIWMAAAFNFLGVLVMTALNATVAQTIYKMVDFGGDPHQALIALCAALFAIVTWATAAWAFGIPTSESHALIAGLSGAAIALHGGGCRGSTAASGSRSSTGWSSLPCWALPWGGCAPRPSSSSFAAPTAKRPWSPFAGHKSAAGPPWPLCTAHRTGRSSWASSCWASFWLAVRGTRRAFRSPSG